MTRAQDPARESEAHFERRLAAAHLVPLWAFFKDWFSAEPHSAAVPHLWRYWDLRPVILEAAAVVSTADAERRVLDVEPAYGAVRLAIALVRGELRVPVY